MQLPFTIAKTTDSASPAGFKTKIAQKDGKAEDGGNLKVEEEKSKKKYQTKWEKEEMRRLLCFVVRHSIDSPCFDLQEMLKSQDYRHYIFEELSETVGSRTRRQCERFIKTMIQEILKRTGQGLLQWALSKLQKSLEIPEVSQLMAEYRQFSGKKSSYMQLMEEWAVELEKKEVM